MSNQDINKDKLISKEDRQQLEELLSDLTREERQDLLKNVEGELKKRENKCKVEDISVYLAERGYSLHAHSADYSIATYIAHPSLDKNSELSKEEKERKTGVCVEYYAKTDTFKLKYVTKTAYTVTSGEAGSIKNIKHFNRLEQNLLDIVNALKVAELN